MAYNTVRFLRTGITKDSYQLNIVLVGKILDVGLYILRLSAFRSPVCSLVSSCVRAFVRSCVRAFVRSCVRAFVHSSARSLARSVRSFVRGRSFA